MRRANIQRNILPPTKTEIRNRKEKEKTTNPKHNEKNVDQGTGRREGKKRIVSTTIREVPGLRVPGLVFNFRRLVVTSSRSQSNIDAFLLRSPTH